MATRTARSWSEALQIEREELDLRIQHLLGEWRMRGNSSNQAFETERLLDLGWQPIEQAQLTQTQKNAIGARTAAGLSFLNRLVDLSVRTMNDAYKERLGEISASATPSPGITTDTPSIDISPADRPAAPRPRTPPPAPDTDYPPGFPEPDTDEDIPDTVPDPSVPQPDSGPGIGTVLLGVGGAYLLFKMLT